jgi:hypothetical protein
MATVKFLTFRAMPHAGNLMPAPSVRECEEISAAYAADTSPQLTWDPDALVNKELKVITTYRGNLVYLEGGLAFHRFDPKSPGANGYSSWPAKGTVEEVHAGNWVAEVEYV